MPRILVEKLKTHLFDPKVPKDIAAARQALIAKAKTYYSNEALNPRPKRGRPPKQVAKVEVETQLSSDLYTHVPNTCRRFLYLPNITSASSITFSEKFDTEEEFLAHLQGSGRSQSDSQLEALSKKFASLRQLSSKLVGLDSTLTSEKLPSFDEEDEDEEEEWEDEEASTKKAPAKKPKKK